MPNTPGTTMTPEQWHRVKEVFEAALERAPSERSLFVGQACGGDDALVREVKSLLSSYEQEAEFMERPAAALAAQSLVKEESAALIGQQLGHYQIIRELGRGGMGVVYLAQDSRLGRPVALKLLPRHLTGDPDRLRRFEREARSASALNHPNILTIHEIGELNGLHFIATEFIDGVTLRERMRSKEIDLSEAIDIAVQIASALLAAHEAGIVHRDIKPENVMLRRDGYVKVLDFGLAKLTEQQAAKATTESPTGVNTDTGTVMGTSGYMSPEQARGLSVDTRADIFSLGVVIYEMVTERMPFEGETPSHVIVSILEQEPPPLTHYLPESPAELQLIISKALRKNRDERYQAVAELLIDLKILRQELGHDAAIGPVKKLIAGSDHLTKHTDKMVTTSRRLSLLAGALILVISASVWFYNDRSKSKSSAPPMKTVLFTSFPGSEVGPAFSPDGNYIAYSWDGEKGDNHNHIYAQVIGAGGPRRITNASGDDIGAAWSRDGRYIAFGRYFEKESGIFLVPALGGAERRLHDVAWVPPGWSVWGVDWSKDGDFVVFPYRKSNQGPFGIYSVSIGDLKEKQLTAPPEEYPGDWHPAISPDGQTLAFIRVSTVGTSDIFLLPILGGQPRRLTFDNKAASGLAWTADGREIVFSSNRGGSQKLWRVPISGGTPEPLSVGGDNTFGLAISGQGNRLAYEQVIEDTDIWRAALPGVPGQRTPSRKFISSSRKEGMVQYSPDGQKIAFWSERSGSGEIWVCDNDGANPVELTNVGGPLTANPRWSPDGKQIAFDSRPNGLSDVFVVNADGGPAHAITTDASEDGLPDWSRDGRWLYFASSRTGSLQVWKAPAAGGEAVQVTKQGGLIAHESTDGKYVYYCKQDTPGIWMVPTGGGEETLLTSLIDTAAWNWTVVDQGIYFVSFDAKLGSAIEFFNLATKKVTRIDRAEKFIPFWSGLSISPDRKWALYTQVEQGGTDLMLVENFR